MAQTFTIVSTLVDALGAVVEDRVKKKQLAKEKKEQDEVEVGVLSTFLVASGTSAMTSST